MTTTYYKLATYCPRTLTFKDGKRAYPTEAAAKAAATATGTYRVSEVPPDGKRRDLAPFEVGVAIAPELTELVKPRKQYPAHATRPMGGRPH